MGIKISLALLLLVAVAVAVAVVARRSHAAAQATQRAGQKRIVSLVLLLREPVRVDEAELRRRFGKVFGVTFGDQPDDRNIVKQFEPEMIGVMVKGRRYGLISVPRRYTEVDAAQLDQLDARVRQALLNHKAWMAVDLMDDDLDARGKADAYRDIGRMLAEFADDNVLAVYGTEVGRMTYAHPQLAEQLRSETPLAALEPTNPPVIQVSGDDPRMRSAVEEARRRWPEFAEAFAKRKPGQGFAAKARFAVGDDEEFMWVQVTQIDGDVVRGTLANEPATLKKIKLHDRVEFRLAELNDWMYEDGREMKGGFTVKALEQIQADRRGGAMSDEKK